MRIHREGIGTLILVGIVLISINLLVLLLWVESNFLEWAIILSSCIVYLFFFQFFRNPFREIVNDTSVLLAPADGRLVVVEETEETEYFNDKRLQVSIFMSPYNVHSNRSPVSGTVKYFKYHPGKYLVAWHPKSSVLNERASIVIEKDDGTEILIRQIAGAVARRIVTYPKVGDRIEQGEELGFIKFGSRVDVFLPQSSDVSAQIGEKIKAGVSIISNNIDKHYKQ